jgi:hypothetical protein
MRQYEAETAYKSQFERSVRLCVRLVGSLGVLKIPPSVSWRSFGRVLDRLEYSLTPSKIVSTLKMLDAPHHEAANAFRAGRKMMDGAGLTFGHIVRALERVTDPEE